MHTVGVTSIALYDEETLISTSRDNTIKLTNRQKYQDYQKSQ
jgi:hypothetical protein